MLVLTIDTATAAVSTALVRVRAGEPGGELVEVLAERVTVDARRHGEALTPGIAECLAEIGATASGIEAVVAGVGPGPFTGLRVGLVTAVAFADALGVPAYGVCTLDALAAPNALVATDARRREVYWAAYGSDGERLHGPSVDRPPVVRTWLDEHPQHQVAAGAGAELYEDVLKLPLTGQVRPSMAVLAALAAERVLAKAPAEPLIPLYLRRPDAVEPAARKTVLA